MSAPLDRPGWALDPAPAGDLLSLNIPQGSGGAQPPVAADPRYVPEPLPLLWPLRTAVFYVWIALVTAFMGLWWLPKVRRDPQNAHVLPVIWTGRLLAAARTILGVSVELRGTPPTEDCVIAAKHQSFLDILAIAHAVPQCAFIMKREVLRVPIMGYYARKAGCIPIDRSRGAEAMTRIIREIEASRADADGLGQLIIYPEGTRTRPGERRKYKHGVGSIQQATRLPVCPVAVNCGMFWPRDGLRVRPGRAVIEFLDPIPAGLSAAQTVQQVETVVEAASDRLMQAAGLGRDG
ncbi:MAG TPA: 1-acyl-sn-glycerol-3-phosphate acyltransferase [Paracoccus solventivorans]|uniref:1-acyl-sn-glycerol-3-phosphate acyltransferase n=1 Tax=Paracoccus solventivorans TaxID=53463 RepID=A0A832QWG1_9RHOB|nr:lysophospholipid acyltransferase family protein [Paracoccus solventivorans]HHW33796.1 1-acyl-sn-glycerol-3-phosphate acyltransferase [Paracoccus solventivorans]